jgi:adenine/guanine/hypoxanthine permease
MVEPDDIIPWGWEQQPIDWMHTASDSKAKKTPPPSNQTKPISDGPGMAATAAAPLEMDDEDDADGGPAGAPDRPSRSRRRSSSSSSWVARIDASVEASCVGRWFKLKERGARCSVEVTGGLASYLTVAYISPLIAGMVAATGATCDVSAGVTEAEYAACKQQVQRELITSVGLASAASTLLMGLWANLPFLLAPGIGTAAYFVYSVVGVRGAGPVPYRTATTAVVLEGLIFLLLSASGVRAWLVKGLPQELQLGMAGGIGLFLAFIGLQDAEGIGLVAGSRQTLVTLGGCPPEYRRYLQHVGEEATAAGPGFECVGGGRMRSPTTWLGLGALLLMTALTEKGVRSAVGGVILAVSCLSWIPGTPVSYFGEDDEGRARQAFFRRGVSVEGVAHVAGQVEFGGLFTDGHVWGACGWALWRNNGGLCGSLYI